MADIKVSALNELTSADADDLLLVTDTSAVESKYIQKGNITQQNFTTALKSKLDGIEASADVTDTANVTAAGAVMDSVNQYGLHLLKSHAVCVAYRAQCSFLFLC